MMRKISFLLALSLLFTARAQVVNINPDKNADPWYVGGLRIPSEEEMRAIPVFEPPAGYERSPEDLPEYWDNSTNDYFRPVFTQSDGSCSQSSGVAYTFTYEINRLNGTDAAYTANQFPSHYTYNFLNDGSGENGSFYTDGWSIIMKGGCPTVPVFGGMAPSDRYWMSGYDKYESGMHDRVVNFFSINVGTPEGLNELKQWMYDHYDGSDTGGVVNFSAGALDTFTMVGNKIVSWGTQVNHAMTFVGWNDNITYDYNNDGQITNDVDINGDGEVNMKDWERGALIMVNSWGYYWGNQGKAYVMYKTLAEPVSNGGIFMNSVHGINVTSGVEPQLILRVKLNYNKRKRIKFLAGYNTDLSAQYPNEVWISSAYFSNQGGDYPMNGTTNVPFEVSFDVSELYQGMVDAGTVKFFLLIQESDPDGTGEGQIIDISLMDGQGNVYECPDHNLYIENHTMNFFPFVVSLEATGTQQAGLLDFALYPNPVDEFANIDFEGGEVSVELTGATGRTVLKTNEKHLDLSGLPGGVYFVKITDSHGRYGIQKLIKK